MLNKKICVVGIGNPLRSDDGIGEYVCKKILEKKIPNLSVIVTQQLDMGISEELSEFDSVIFGDASENEKEI